MKSGVRCDAAIRSSVGGDGCGQLSLDLGKGGIACEIGKLAAIRFQVVELFESIWVDNVAIF